MLQTLEIQNFQSHKNTVLEFSPGLNVITGSSDSGKSAIIRALLLALTNKPSSDAYRSWNAGENDSVEVALGFNNGWFIRKRENGKNMYVSEDGKFEALRSEVPQSIQDIANIVDYNIQTQHQPYFLLQDSPGDRAKKLNDLVGLSIIDSIFKKLNSKITTTKQSIKNVTEEIASLEETLEGLSYLTSVELQINKLCNDIKQYTGNSGRASSLQELLYKVGDIDSLMKSDKKVLKIEPTYNELMSKITERENLQDKLDALTLSVTQYSFLQNSIKEDQDWLEVEKPYAKIMEMVNRKTSTLGKGKDLYALILNINGLGEGIAGFNLLMNDQVNRYAAVLKEAGTCPTCMSPINHKRVIDIVTKLREE